MPDRPTNLGAAIIRHTGYSLAAPGLATSPDMYKDRPRITTRSTKLQGGVYYPKSLEGQMEAVVVDYEKDRTLAAYIDHIEQYAHIILQQMKLAGRSPTFDDLVSIVARKIPADFPYSHRMLDHKYLDGTYPPGKKVHLGVIMAKQDMICRHMALLFSATIEHLRDKGNPAVNMHVSSDTDVRYTADTQYDPLEKDLSGHGYVVMKRFEGGHTRYLVADPTASRVFDIRDVFKPSARDRSPNVYRYLFSVLRVVFQESDARDGAFKHWLTRARKGNAQIQRLVSDVEKAYVQSGDIIGIQNIRGYLAKGV